MSPEFSLRLSACRNTTKKSLVKIGSTGSRNKHEILLFFNREETIMTAYRSLTAAAPMPPEILLFPSSTNAAEVRSFASMPNGVGDDESLSSILFDMLL